MDPPNPIPDLPLREYFPASFRRISLWGRVVRKVNWGHRGSYRRAWVDATANTDGEPAFISSELDSWHCSADADLIFNGAKPSLEVLTQFSDLHVEIIDHSVSGARIFRWDRDGLKFEIRALAMGQHLYEIIAVSRGKAPNASKLDDHLALARRNLGGSKQSQRHNCIHTLWRFLYCVVLGIGLAIPAIIVASLISAALGIGSLNGLLALVTFIATFFLVFLWFNRRQRKYLNEHWCRVFRDGDHDGTVRRALLSIGIELPASNLTA
jgi:hypothetical protein